MKFTTSLKKNHEFRRLYAKGKSAASKYVVIYMRRNYIDSASAKRSNLRVSSAMSSDNACVNRLGITVSTKIGGAVVRNRVRRRLKEVYRLNEHTLRPGYDIVIVARIKCVDAQWSDLRASIMFLFKKLGLLT